MNSRLTLDDLYAMVAHIYSEQTLARTTAAGFAAFVEACGMLTIHESKKVRDETTVTDALCKTLGWYIALLVKMKIKSIEEILYRKFPYACPYCLLTPHSTTECKKAGDSRASVDNDKLKKLRHDNIERRPKGLDEWQTMFQEIYPRSPEDGHRSLLGLLEELGELAEAIRVFGKDPKYFVGEAADTFSYIMGIANEHKIRLALDGQSFSFEEEFIKRYPGLCLQCGYCICVCPAVPRATVGRPAKEIDIGVRETLFFDIPLYLTERGQRIGRGVRVRAFATADLATKLPFHRGQVNNAFTILLLLLAEAVIHRSPSCATQLTARAIAIGKLGTVHDAALEPLDPHSLLDELAEAWKELARDDKALIKTSGGLLSELCDTVEMRARSLYQHEQTS